MSGLYKRVAVWLFVALLASPLAADTDRSPASPGTVNYVEGRVSLDSQLLSAKSVGSAIVEPGHAIITDQGKTEVLLTPGVFLRLGDRSAAQMVASGLTDTRFALNQGEALVEVDEIHPQNNIRIVEAGTSTRIDKTGLYAFDAASNLVRVIDGQAHVRENDRDIKIKGGHELQLNSAVLKPSKFNKKAFESEDLYRWSSLRSDYLGEANIDAARTYIVDGWYGPGWFGPGWYWDPFFSAYTFIPGEGIFYNPFGWGFYSPIAVYRSPYFYGYPGYGNRPVRALHAPGPYHNRTLRSAWAAGHPATSGGHPFGSFSAGRFGGGGFHGGGTAAGTHR